jgi:hypothetical protein
MGSMTTKPLLSLTRQYTELLLELPATGRLSSEV